MWHGQSAFPVLANIFMSKLEMDVVRPYNPPFYNRYVDDCFSKRKQDAPDELLQQLNDYHRNIKFTVEERPARFLDTAFVYIPEDKFECGVYKKPGRYPTHWRSEIPTKWKRNCILGDLQRAKRISTNFQ